MKKKISLIMLFLMVISFSVQAKSDVTYPVEIRPNIQGSKILANNFIYEIKEGIRKSNNMTLNDEGLRIALIINIINANEQHKEASISYAVTWVLVDMNSNAYYLHSSIGVTGSIVYEDAAKNIVAETDGVISRYINE